MSAREAMASSRNRVALTQGLWRAQACLVLERDVLRETLARQPTSGIDSSGLLWNYVDRIVTERPAPIAGCALSVQPVGARLNINTADDTTVSRLLQVAGWPAVRADSIAAALADWIDADNQPRPKGAERDWYEARDLTLPSNSPFIDLRELEHVRGLDVVTVERLSRLFDVEPGAIALNQATPELLALLPGFTERTIREVLDARARGRPITAFIQLLPWLDPGVPGASARIPGLVLLAPEAWIITARSSTGIPPVTVVVELRLGRGNGASIVTRRRTWIE